MVMWNSFTEIVSLHHKQDDFDQKRPLPSRFALNLKNAGLIFFKITEMQSVSVLSICLHPCFSFLLFYSFYVV